MVADVTPMLTDCEAMKHFVLLFVALVCAMAALVSDRGVSFAMPVNIWVFNGNVAAATAVTPVTPAAFHAALTTSAATRAPYLGQFAAFQARSGGQTALTSAIPYAGTTYIVAETESSTWPVTLNGRGLVCTPACDDVASTYADATDHMVVFSVTGTGPRSIGDARVATVQNEAVTFDSTAITVVGHAHDATLSMVSGDTALLADAPSCQLGDSIADPTRAGALLTYTDINGTPLVGYQTGWDVASSPFATLAAAASTSWIRPDGYLAAYNVVCGVSPGGLTLQASAADGAIEGVSGPLVRAQALTVTAELDSDGDGYSDAQEAQIGKNPNVYCAVMRADVNNDGKATLADLILIAGWYNQYAPPAPTRYDQKIDAKMTLADLILVAQVYQHTVNSCP